MLDLPARSRTATATARSAPAGSAESLPGRAGGTRRETLTRAQRVLASTALLALALVGCSGGDKGSNASPSPSNSNSTNGSAASGVPAELVPFYNQKPRWSGCSGDFECTKVKVPLDYKKPTGDTVELEVIRLPAGDESKRVGSLLINPGGPGASGVSYARQARAVLSDDVRNSFDVVGWDPRGVGDSAPVKCLDDKQLDAFLALDGSPDDQSEVRALDATSKNFAHQCEARSGKVLPRVGTPDAARDMDILRAVLGDAKLNYLGKSYGTFLGATYAELFPEKVGRVVLDGAIDPSVTSQEMGLAQAGGFEQALDAFIDDCLKQSDCPVGPDTAGAKREIAGILDQADRSPLRTDSGRPLTQSLAILGVAVAMYDSEQGWPALRIALQRAKSGDGTVLLQLSDIYTDRQSNGHYSSNQNEAIYAVNCLDRPDRSSPAQIEQVEPRFEKESPTFGDYLAWSSLPCRYWPAKGEPGSGPHKITAEGAAPIVVVGTTRDPATPYVWAQNLADQLSSGVLLSWDGDGHTAYFRGSSCIDSAVDDYLIKGTVPKDGTRCS
jgi:pimeloyl-ACP methyl ester carboxylesterase